MFVVGQNADSLFVMNHIVNDLNHNPKEFKKIKQLVVTYQLAGLNTFSMVTGLARKKGNWEIAIAPVRASIGRNGYANPNDKVEGDGKTPMKLYALGQLYSYDAKIDTKIPFQQVDEQDKWIDDSSSNDYNKYIRGETNAKSFEHLKLKSIDYKYCMIIEYNTKPVVKGKGSAIFFHVVNENYSATAGCVAIVEKDMLQFLKWFKPKKKKAILILGEI
jgi:L,D-peptidoglycan transpeptidase YkuD (ErfK/YbiS/YcfS/YnhG family)